MLQPRSNRGIAFLFPAESDHWLSLLRMGLGIQLVLYCCALRRDWVYLLTGSDSGLINRYVSELFVVTQSRGIPVISWFVEPMKRAGFKEDDALWLVWTVLLAAGVALLVGFLCRTAAVTAWLLHLAVAKSGGLTSYGVENFMTIGLFYLMLAPTPDRLAIDRRLWRTAPPKPEAVGFFRRCLQLHLCIVYFYGGATKALGAGWWSGLNLWRALTRPPFDTIPANVLASWSAILPALGIAIILIEILYPFLVWSATLRRASLIVVCGMHTMIGVAMAMPLFALVMIVLNVAAFGPRERLSSRCAANE
jgi:hypothetical protein